MFGLIGAVIALFIVGVIAQSIMPGIENLGFKAKPCLHP